MNIHCKFCLRHWSTSGFCLCAPAAMPRRFRAKCKECNEIFFSSTSQKSARSCRDRHLREAHTLEALSWRRARNARRQAAARLSARAASHSMAAAVRVLVLCSLRREVSLALLTGARKSFLCWGIPAASIRRVQGVDLARATPRDRVPRPSMVVTRALLREFVPAARAIFARTPRVRYVVFAEDDCHMKRGVSLEALIEACRTARGLRRAAGLAFKTSGGEPKVGAHLLTSAAVLCLVSSKTLRR